MSFDQYDRADAKQATGGRLNGFYNSFRFASNHALWGIRQLNIGRWLSVGSISTPPASTGALRIPNNSYLVARNVNNTGDNNLIGTGGSDVIGIDTLGNGVVMGGSATTFLSLGTVPAATGILRLPNAKNIVARRADNNADITVIGLDAANGIVVGAKVSSFNAIATTGEGVPAIYGYARPAAGQTGAVASVAAYTVGAADGSFIVSANVLVTTSTLHNFTVTCTYTDEGGTSRTVTLNFSLVAGTIGTAIANAAGAVPYEGIPLHIRAKAATAITIATTGTFTTVTYNVEGAIVQIG